QMSYTYFPIMLEEFGATVRFQNLLEGTFDLGPVRVTTQIMNHPTLTFGYRLEMGGKVVVYIPDHEPNSLHPKDAPPGAPPVHREDRRHLEFLEGADLLIHDAQYTLREYPAKVGWGHSPFEKTVDYAIAAKVKRLALFHHDPLCTDENLDLRVEAARKRASEGAHTPEVFAAAEGMVMDLPGEAAPERPPISSESSALLPPASEGSPSTVLLIEDDPNVKRILRLVLDSDHVHVLSAIDGETGVEIALKERPGLILLDLVLPGIDGLEVCRRIRASADEMVKDVPIVIITGVRMEEEDVLACFDAGATDYMTKPVTATQLLARVHSWLLRTARQ
ncbi:MAG: response regulator, partial [bacterium]